MKADKQIPKNIDDYIDRSPAIVRLALRQMRSAIGKAAPNATEAISYGIPMLSWNGSRVYFAAFRNHIGFYPGAAAIKTFDKQLKRYKRAKGSVQFPLDHPLPLALVTRIVKFRVSQGPLKKRRK